MSTSEYNLGALFFFFFLFLHVPQSKKSRKIELNVFFSPVQELFSACNPMLTKPKPKVEPPKEEKTENGPVNGQEGTESQPSKTDKAASGGTEQETAETKPPEMDID